MKEKLQSTARRWAVCLFLLMAVCTLPATAQSTVKYGTLSYDSLLHVLPAWIEVQGQMAELRKKYEAEAQYNEQSFRRLFAEFLQGQKDFPQNILLKRQRDLQDAVEKSIAFRHEADSLLARAEADLIAPVRRQLDQAIRAVGMERGYECVINTDAQAVPFVHPSLTENAAPFVLAKISGK